MEKLDQAYLTDLVTKVMAGSSNAFAELFAAVHPRLYAYIRFMLSDEEKADAMMETVCIHVLHNANRIQNPEVFMPWCFRLAYHYCVEQDYMTEKKHWQAQEDTLALRTQILSLPLMEAQVLLMYYLQGISIPELGELLNFSRRFIRRVIKTGRRHLSGSGAALPGSGAQPSQRLHQGAGFQIQPFEQRKKIRMLAKIYEACEREPNTVPMEALSDYTVYRKERFNLQRIVTGAAMALFLLLPMLFILPSFDVDTLPEGERGLPVYTVSVRSVLPVRRVLASQSTHNLPVYEASSKIFRIEPTRNGILRIVVELFNRQQLQKEIRVTEVDAHGPQMTDSLVSDETVTLMVKDAGIGVDYYSIYAVDQSGRVYRPISFDQDQGQIIFVYPEDNWDVYIPDYLGNVLHLAFTFA